MWIVTVPGEFFEQYIKKVISYRRNKAKMVIIKTECFKYKHEKSAMRAALAFGGSVVMGERNIGGNNAR